MRQLVRSLVAIGVLSATMVVLFTPSAEAVPSYTRRYGFDCSSCHTMWGALNAAGVTFRLSGYRAMFGKDLVPIEAGKDINIPGTSVKIPGSLPFSFITGVGYDYRQEKRTAFDGSTTTRTGSSLALEDASIFLTTPVGDHFSAFVEFPMYETRAWEFTPTGQSGATNATSFPGGANDPTTNRHFQFSTEKPIFEVAKFFWNNLFGDSLQRDSVNGLIGITHLPLPYSPGKVRLSVNQYEIYERRALDLISPNHSSLMGPADDLFRLSEPQILAELNGMVVPSGIVGDSAKKETLWFEYHIGATNGNNDNTNNNTSFGGYGRLVGRWYNQSLGVFGFYKPDIYDDNLRTDGAFMINTFNGGLGAPGCNVLPPGNTGTQCANTGIFNPLNPQAKNGASAFGVDGTLSLAPWGIPVSLDNQIMWRKETNPTGFGVAFSWKGGFNQLNWFILPNLVTYARYDWIRGNTFNDTSAGGITFSDPREWDIVWGIQYAIFQNVKVVGEYRYHEFKDNAVGTPGTDICVAAGNPTCQPYTNRVTAATLKDNGFTARLMMGF